MATLRSYKIIGRSVNLGLKRTSRTNFNIDLVTAQHDGNILANTLEITMPVGYIPVRDTGSDIEHYNATLALDIIPIAQATKFLLAGGIPYIEAYGTVVGRESQRVDLDTESGCFRRRVA